MMEIDGRHTIKNKNEIFKKRARVRRMDVREKQLVINQYVYFYYIVYIYMILNKYMVRYIMINVDKSEVWNLCNNDDLTHKLATFLGKLLIKLNLYKFHNHIQFLYY